MNPLLEAIDLRLSAGGRPIVDGVSFRIAVGEAVAITGPSGSGKTSLALAVLGHLRPGVTHTGGQLLADGNSTLPAPWPGLRGGLIGYVGQDPGGCLNPYRRISDTLLRSLGRRVARADRAATVQRLLARVGLPDLSGRYPHQLSGGQQQRVAMAAALARDPRVLLLDEPTTALDLLAKAEVIAELHRLSQAGVTLLWITHDLSSLRSVAPRVLELDEGRLVADTPAGVVPERLEPVRRKAAGLAVTAARTADPVVAADGADAPPVLVADGVSAGYGRQLPSVLSGVGLEIWPGECLAVLGTSGVGKSTFARVLAGLHRPSAGVLRLHDEPVEWDVRRRSRAERAAVQLVGQDPAEALHPRQSVRTALVRPLLRLRGLRQDQCDGEVKLLLDSVRLPVDLADRFPGELSGGQRQRVALARALAARPDVLVCDEVTSALDTGTQTAVLRMLTELRAELGLAVVLITHDPEVAATASDRVLVLAGGQAKRTGPTGDLLPPGESPEERVHHLLTDRSEGHRHADRAD